MRDRLRKLWPFVKVLLGLAVIVIIGRRFYKDLSDPPEGWERSLRPGWLVLSGGLYLVGLGFSGLCWHRLLLGLGQRLPCHVALRAYYIGHMGKYLPGKAWALFLRASLVAVPGVSPMLATITAFYEVFVTMSAGVLTAAVLFTLLLPPDSTPFHPGHWWEQFAALLNEGDGSGPPLDRTFAVTLALVLLVPLLLPILPPVFNRLAHRLSLPFRTPETVLPKFRTRGLVEGLCATGLGWLCLGASLWSALRGTLPEPPHWTADNWGLLTAIMGVSYVAGFVVLVAPSGMVVRELVLTLLLAAFLGRTPDVHPHSFSVSVWALRVVWTAAEVVMIALVWRLPGPPVLLRKDTAA